MSRFWNTFEMLCAKRNATPTYVAAQCGIGKSTTTGWRRGAIPQKAQLESIAKYFGISVDDLLGYDSQSSHTENASRKKGEPATIFWKRFEELCNQNKVFPSSVANQLGFSNAAASSWKKGATPRHSTLVAIAEYFGVNVDTFLEGYDVDDGIIFQEQNKQELYDYVKAMSDDDAAFALQLLKKLIDGK